LIEGSLRIAVNPSSRAGIELSRSSFAFLEVFRDSHGNRVFGRAVLVQIGLVLSSARSSHPNLTSTGRRPLLRTTMVKYAPCSASLVVSPGTLERGTQLYFHS
jgi:hypothetical protein